MGVCWLSYWCTNFCFLNYEIFYIVLSLSCISLCSARRSSYLPPRSHGVDISCSCCWWLSGTSWTERNWTATMISEMINEYQTVAASVTNLLKASVSIWLQRWANYRWLYNYLNLRWVRLPSEPWRWRFSIQQHGQLRTWIQLWTLTWNSTNKVVWCFLQILRS